LAWSRKQKPLIILDIKLIFASQLNLPSSPSKQEHNLRCDFTATKQRQKNALTNEQTNREGYKIESVMAILELRHI
jgi:hypothetical protein